MPEAKPGPVPELRFPEFREAGPWEVKRLGEIAELKAGKFIPASDIRADSEHGLNPCYGGNGLRGFTESFTHSGEYPLIGRQGAYSGNVQLAEGRFHATEHAIVVTPVESASTKFLFKLLVRANLSRLVTGQAQPGLSVARLNGVSLPLPSLPEQKKIADCLGSLDDLIRAEEARLEALCRHKTGLMQCLFPAPGQTTPRLRFPEFRDAGPWEVKRLGELLALEYGSSLPEDQRIDGPFPVVGSNGVVGYHNASLIDGPAIVIGRKGSAGEISWIENACFPIDTTFYVKLRRPSDRLDFIKSLLEMHRLPDLVSPGGVPGLNRDDVQVVRTAIPKPEEQQKIADCLTALDDLIRAQGETIEALKTHKRGLMNRLFPREVG